MTTAAAFSASSVHEFTLQTIDGQPAPLSAYKGKAVLFVNVASKCGYTPQYAGLQSLYSKYKDKGLVIVGVPANNFGGQEPGTNEEIAQFCSVNYDVTFPLFSKISVKGSGQAPLYQYLTKEAPHHGEIQWNFHKFLVDKNGAVVANIGPRTTPEEVAPQIEKLL